ncbi:hypothetical protein B566_EDAN004430 [Ephemera danica]|nr:hypothetical protein B566_EDAN004430 [Ephemera danica]
MPGRKPKKFNEQVGQQASPTPYGIYGAPNPNMYNPNMSGGYMDPNMGYDPNTGAYPGMNAYGASPPPVYSAPAPEYQQMPGGWAVPGLTDPMAAAAMQYGQTLVGQGKQAVGREIERYVPIDKIKYYFAVDTGYVTRKLILLLFPFGHKDWSVKYESDSQPVQPRYEINAPDLYIPVMAYVTYVLVAGLVLGTQDRFTPEVLGIQASSALAWVLLELAVVSISMIIFAVLVSLLFKSTGYWIALIYCSLALGFFLIRSLKSQLLAEPGSIAQSDPYSDHNSMHHSSPGTKRRLYLMMVMSATQTLIMWRLSAHLG